MLVGVQARPHGLDPALEEAALDLGATPVQAFWLVVVPYLMPAIVSGALMSFTLSLDESHRLGLHHRRAVAERCR